MLRRKRGYCSLCPFTLSNFPSPLPSQVAGFSFATPRRLTVIQAANVIPVARKGVPLSHRRLAGLRGCWMWVGVALWASVKAGIVC